MVSIANIPAHMFALYDGYLWTLTFADKRVADWPLMSSPKYTAAFTLCYLLMVWLGPRLMENYKPLQLRLILISYNLGMVLLNLYMFAELLYCSLALGYNYSCQPVNYSNNPYEVRIAKALWWFYMSKCFEFADTLFFIIRKKNSQITFLHVYHHATMFCLWWIGIKWVAGGSGTLILLSFIMLNIFMSFLVAMLNSFVHVCMYSYYLLTSLFSNSRISWKKYLTALQLTQFFIAIAQGTRSLSMNPRCPFPMWMHYTLIGYMISFIVLFLNFWRHAYRKPKVESYKNGHLNGTMTNGSVCTQPDNGFASFGNGKQDSFMNGTCNALDCSDAIGRSCFYQTRSASKLKPA